MGQYSKLTTTMSNDNHQVTDGLNNKMDDSRFSNSVVSKDKFGSILDYLEAKYVKGVMVADDKIRQKKKQKNKPNDNDDNDNDDNSEEEESLMSKSEAGSCYSNASGGFIDDSELKSELAQQVMTSSAYGTTRIETEGFTAGCDLERLKEDNNAFFVNVGDLEMADSWESDQHWKVQDDNDNNNNNNHHRNNHKKK